MFDLVRCYTRYVFKTPIYKPLGEREIGVNLKILKPPGIEPETFWLIFYVVTMVAWSGVTYVNVLA